ncbi:MAG: HAD family phosphatase [Phycisphaerales bacterium]|nr:HAD family phosphatase [Phycisphaerales bacterium]
MKRAIVFDFDGVIVDSEPMHESALLEAARAMGLSFTHEQYVNAYLGFDDRDTWRAIAKDNGRTLSEAETARLNELKWTAVRRAMARGEPRAFPGSVELIRAAAERGPVGLCSGARQHEIDPILRRLGVLECFGAIVTADDVAVAKPDPAGYALTARRLGVAADRVKGFAPVAIEDTLKGVKAARLAGYRVVAVRHSLVDAVFEEADVVADSTAALSVEALLRA